MKRDLDLCRRILLWVEEQEHGFVGRSPEVEGVTDEEIGFHVHLLGEAGLLKTTDRTFLESRSPQAIPLYMTWAGYEFLAAAKDESLWSKARAKVLKPAGGVAFDVLLEWLKSEAKSRLGIS